MKKLSKKVADWTKRIQVYGQERKKILSKFSSVLKRWNLKMPPVKPLVLDFGLGNFYQTGLIEYWVSNENKQGYCGKFLFVFNNQTCPYHHHIFKHETFFVLKGKVRMKTNNKTMIKKSGGVLIMPQRTKHSFTGKGNALLLEVSKPCLSGDNIFQEKKIGNHGVI